MGDRSCHRGNNSFAPNIILNDLFTKYNFNEENKGGEKVYVYQMIDRDSSIVEELHLLTEKIVCNNIPNIQIKVSNKMIKITVRGG